ncbi:MAG: glycosyltransferase, partial [Gemmatimonadota bacterium]|nr:glycosyltransferase [Gemmatimonadota bacterium]
MSIHRFLSRRQIPCAVISLSTPGRTEADDVYRPRNALEVLSLLLRLRYEIVHLHIGGNLTTRLLALGLVCCLIPRAKSVLTFHSGGYPSSPEGRAARSRSLRGLVLRRFDRLIGVNAEIVKLFHRLGCSPNRTRLISPHAVMLPAGPDSDGAKLRAPLPVPLRRFWESHAPVLLTVGLLEPEYDLRLQLEVLGRIRKSYPGAGLAIIG